MRGPTVALLVLAITSGCGSRSALWSPSRTEAGGQRAVDAPLTRLDRWPRHVDDLLAGDRQRSDAALPPCGGQSGQAVTSFSEKMVVCRSAPESWVDQCGAAKLCGPGWRLCNPAEYQARFGPAAGPPGTETTWIGACIRSGGAPHAPSSGPCGQCPTQASDSPMVGWYCWKDGGGMVGRLFVGVGSHPECYRVGVNVASTAAYWSPLSPDYKLRQSFCCRD
jgi:hypothetical protein